MNKKAHFTDVDILRIIFVITLMVLTYIMLSTIINSIS